MCTKLMNQKCYHKRMSEKINFVPAVLFIFILWVEIEQMSIQASGRRTSQRRRCQTENYKQLDFRHLIILFTPLSTVIWC